jgi:4-aminobutyrate aminotransferase-like enzyme
VDVLARHECPAITARRLRRALAVDPGGTSGACDPIVWDEAVGANVRDADGNVFVDLTAGFGAAFVGHRHPEVVAAVDVQMRRLVHASGDAWPDTTRIRLLERLAADAPPGADGPLEVSILGLSGSDAVDAAVKTARLATGRPGVLTFSGGYHGLALGVLGLQRYNPAFTDPFREIVHPHVREARWAGPASEIEAALADGTVGLVLVEPIQGRGGVRVPPPGWLREVATTAHRAGALLAFDEVFTGIARTGAWFACGEEGIAPDLLCVGKGLGGGWPLSACLGTRAAMSAWGASTGEALHTQTFLGHPVGCAAALAVLDLVVRDDLTRRAREVGADLTARLTARGFSVRGRGVMLGVPLPRPLESCRALLQRGFITLPAGAGPEVLELTPPVCLTPAQADAFVDALAGSC